MVKVSKTQVDKLQEKWRRPIIDEESAAAGETKEDFKEDETSISVVEPGAMMMLRTASAPATVEFVKNTNMAATPSEDFTGVEKSITEICACISKQVYYAKSKKDFKLEARATDDATPPRTAEVIIYDDHGDLSQTSPTFVVAATGDTLIMGWQGSSYLMDFVVDIAFNPVTSPELGKAASGIKGSGAFFSHVASDLLTHQDKIKDCIENKKRKTGQEDTIKRIVFTGHSLAGGLANVAHLFIQSQINDETTVWGGLDYLSLKTVTFAAVMSFLDLEEVEGENEHSKKLVDQVKENNCNIIFGPDVVPRAYAHCDYLYDVLKKASNEVINDRMKLVLRPFRGMAKNAIFNLVQAQIGPLVGVMMKYRHLGTLVYYENENVTEPLKLQDTGPTDEPITDKTNLNFYSLSKYTFAKNEVLHTLLAAHGHFPRALSPYLPKEN